MRNIIQKVTQYITRLLSQTINNQKGVVLPIILMAIGGLSLIGAAAVSVSSGEMNIAHNDRNYKIALNLAEAGISDAADAIAGNREILPAPMGSITTTSYAFNVGGTAFNNTGRYNVIVTLPIFTTVQNIALVGASSVDIADISKFNVGDSVIIGNENVHIMANIGSIIPTGGTSGTLNLVDGKKRPYILGQQLDTTMKVAKNFIRITSTGEAGAGMGSTYNAPALWRASSAIIANNPSPALMLTPPVAGAGMIRSTLTLQAEYSIQEINIMGRLTANVNAIGSNSKLDGPVLISDSPTQLGQLSISPYSQGDYSGPIFMSTSAINGNKLNINGGNYNPIANGINGSYPKIIPISPTAAQKADVNKILNQAKASADCYQTACGLAGATQQIYNVNGYKLQVKVFQPQKGGGLQLSINDESTDLAANGDVTLNFEVTQDFSLTSSDDVPLVYTDTIGTPPVPSTNTTLKASTATISKKGKATDTGSVMVTGGKVTFKGSGATALTYSAGTIITVTIPQSEMTLLGSGKYVWLYDNSNNIPGFGGGKSYSNGVFMTALGNLQSEQWQGDVVYQNDAGNHTHLTPIIQPTAPTIWVRGLYAQNDNTLAPWTTAAQAVTDDQGAVLFGGRLSGTSTTWNVGDQAEYKLTYYIHTNGPICSAHDIQITSRTIVTYIGTSTKCSDNDNRRVFIYESVWNHLATNKINKGIQPDDADPKLVQPVAHKGYYKWDGGKDVNDNELIIIGKTNSIVMGDKEFNSVFNHAYDPNDPNKFHSAIVNLNISQLNMIAAANPPTIYNAGKMWINPASFSATAWIPANTKNWDLIEMIGNRSGYTATPDTNGFDFTDFSIASGSVLTYSQNGSEILPDVSATPGAGNTSFGLYRSTAGTPEVTAYQNIGGVPTLVNGNAWAFSNTAPFQNNGTPIMNASQLPTTTITATISGPYFTKFQVRRGSVNLFFDPANGIPFNINELSVKAKGTGANITMGSTANPVMIYAGKFSLSSTDCGGLTNFNYVGKITAGQVSFGGDVKYDVQSTMTNAPSCLTTTNNFIYLKKTNWKEIRN